MIPFKTNENRVAVRKIMAYLPAICRLSVLRSMRSRIPFSPSTLPSRSDFYFRSFYTYLKAIRKAILRSIIICRRVLLSHRAPSGALSLSLCEGLYLYLGLFFCFRRSVIDMISLECGWAGFCGRMEC